MNAFA
ncbi:hypothetical protein D049_3983A, partial [Vibrio parahaemolyticus VPTS-2010]